MPSILSTRLLLVFVATLGTTTSFYLLLTVVPLYATSIGAGDVGARFATGALMFSTVAAELAAPALLTRFGYRPVLAVGLLLLGAPALLLPFSTDLTAILGVRSFVAWASPSRSLPAVPWWRHWSRRNAAVRGSASTASSSVCPASSRCHSESGSPVRSAFRQSSSPAPSPRCSAWSPSQAFLRASARPRLVRQPLSSRPSRTRT